MIDFDGAQLDQLGFDCSDGDDSLKMTALESGYVEEYRPSEFDTEELLPYLLEAVVPHARGFR